jgi:hypothetical protein
MEHEGAASAGGEPLEAGCGFSDMPALSWLLPALFVILIVAKIVDEAVKGVRRGRFQARGRHGEGATAATAIEAPGWAAVERHLRGRRCACGRTFDAPPAPASERLRYGERVLHVVPVACAGCGRRESVYFDVKT